MSISLLKIRRWCNWQLLCFILCAGIGLYAAQQISAQTSVPTADDVQQEVANIEAELSRAHCGGWIPFSQIDNYSASGYVATTTGLPGRGGNPVGDIPSGMAQRHPNFIYPAQVTGVSTACRPGNPPFLEDHACQRPGEPSVYKNGENANSDPLGNGVQWSCNALASDINRRWKKKRWIVSCPEQEPDIQESECYDVDTDPEPEGPSPDGCSVTEQILYCCTNSESAPNAVLCQDDECRGEQQTIGDHTSLADPYVSFYRRYEGSCQRRKFPDPYVQDDDNERTDVPVSCYGFYEEYDPLQEASEEEDFSCVIANTYPGTNHHFLEMSTTQRSNLSAVEYGQNMAGTQWPDPPSEDYTLTRIPQTSLWLPLNGGFSLTDKRTLQNQYNNDLTYALFTADEADMRAYPQLSVEQPKSTGALLRAFDDTVPPDGSSRRYFTEWWQEIGTEMDQLLSPPHVRLILPHPVALELDRNDPFVAEQIRDMSPAAGQPESVEVLLQAEEDIVGSLSAYFERSDLLQIQPEPLPLVVPFGSPVELRALADSWCTWYMDESGNNTCNDAPADVQAMRQRLDGYADYIDNVRTLRAELQQYESALLERQEKAIRILHDWVNQIGPVYNEYLDETNRLGEIRERWARIQEQYATFHDESNMPWCMNDRFTTPIYSLLDEWYPGRPRLDGNIDSTVVTATETSALPRLDIYPPQYDPSSPHDVVIDFSHFVRANTLKLPVIQPIQVRLDWSIYTPPNRRGGSVPDLPPPLPDVPTIQERVQESWPDVVPRDTPPVIRSFIPETATSINPVFLLRVERMIEDMNERYRKFWDSLLLNPERVTNGTEEDCPEPDTVPCVHVEMDLKERFQRMCARPAVLMKEDFAAIGDEWIAPEEHGYDTCDPADWSCQLLWRQEEFSEKGWVLRHPDKRARGILLDGLRRDMFYDTLLRPGIAPEDALPFVVQPGDITPSFAIPHSGGLLPGAASLPASR